MIASGPLIEAQYTWNTMIDRANAVRTAGVPTRLLKHAVTLGDEIGGIHLTPENAALFQGVEPVVQNLSVRAYRVRCMCALNCVFVQKRHGRLDELKVSSE